MVELWKAGLMEYPDLDLKKPIKFTEEFLKEIATNTSKIDVTSVDDEKGKHEDRVLGNISNFSYDNGVLNFENLDGFELSGMGLSPSFYFEALEDCGDYYIPYNGKLLNVGLTNNPRNRVLYNSIRGDDSMAEDNIDKLLAQIEDRDNKIGSLKTQLSQKNKDIESKDKVITDYESELTTLRESVEGLDDIKDKASKYEEIEVKNREELIEKLSKGNDVIKKTFEDFDIAQLEALEKANIVNNPGKGTSYPNTDVDNDGEKLKPKDDDKVYSDEEFKNDLAELGLDNMVDME